MKIVIIDYGAGNVFSVQRAVERLGYEVLLSRDPMVVQSADRVIFPGVGQASVAMKRLRDCGLDQVIPELRVPVLGICLGMQLMCRYTEEGDTAGLNIFPLDVLQIRGMQKIPHIGWNTIDELESGLFTGCQSEEWMYFVHSYYVPDNGYRIAVCNYQCRFAAAIRKENFYGCQFHPEKSSRTGEMVLRNFICGY